MAVFSSDETVFALGYDGGGIELRSVQSGTLLRGIKGDSDCPVQALAFSPNGKLLMSGYGTLVMPLRSTWDSTIHLWEVSTGTQLFVIPGKPRISPLLKKFLAELHGPLPSTSPSSGHGGEVHQLAFSPSGRLAASVSDDQSVRVWEIATAKEVCSFDGFGDAILSVAFTPDGKTLAVGSGDGTCWTWDLAPPRSTIAGKELPAQLVEKLWQELGNDDPRKAYQAVLALCSAGSTTTTFLKGRLRPAVGATRERIEQLIKNLGSPEFQTRELASKELMQLGLQVFDHLREVLATTKSTEVRLRAKALLDRLPGWAVQEPETLRVLRAIWVLEWIGSPEACQILQELARGAPGFRLTQEAQAALGLLKRTSQRLPNNACYP